MKCRLSIIIPAYNSEVTIARCLDSVKSQLTDDVEVIVVDDGSSDSTPAICNGYSSSDSRFKIIHKENGGVSSARNVGLDHSDGSWITFLDSDDKLADGALDRMICAINTCKEMVITNVIMCDVSGNSFPVLPEVMDTLDRMFCEPLSGSVVNKIFRRDIIESNGIHFDTSLSFFEDWLFIGRYCSFVREFEYINAPCYVNYLPYSYAEKYGQLRDFRHMSAFYSKLKSVNTVMSYMWVDPMVMTLLCETGNFRTLCEKVSILKSEVGRDIIHAKGARKFGIRLLMYSDCSTIWYMVFGGYYLLKCF